MAGSVEVVNAGRLPEAFGERITHSSSDNELVNADNGCDKQPVRALVSQGCVSSS